MPKQGKKGVRKNKGDLSNEWDELAATSGQALLLTRGLQENSKVINTAVKNMAAMHLQQPLEGVTGEELTGIVAQARTVNRDVTKYSEEVVEIANGHKDKSGGLRSADQQFELFGHAQKYHDLTNQATDLAAGDMGDLFASITDIVQKNPGREIDAEGLAKAQAQIDALKKVKAEKETK